ncbi:hypothetical protein IV102_06695 [bacterium]|nr:hypothetical protein [bacterium]
MLTTVGGVSGVSTDQPKLQATFTYDDEKVKIDEILEKMKTQNNGRYQASVVEKTPK